MRGKKPHHGFFGVVACSVLNKKDMARGLCQDIAQKGSIAVRVELFCMGQGNKRTEK